VRNDVLAILLVDEFVPGVIVELAADTCQTCSTEGIEHTPNANSEFTDWIGARNGLERDDIHLFNEELRENLTGVPGTYRCPIILCIERCGFHRA
jgi:hypothetical protein